MILMKMNLLSNLSYSIMTWRCEIHPNTGRFLLLGRSGILLDWCCSFVIKCRDVCWRVALCQECEGSRAGICVCVCVLVERQRLCVSVTHCCFIEPEQVVF